MNMKDEIAQLRSDLGSLKNEVQELRRFQSWIMGAVVGFGVLLAFFADGIKKGLGLGK